MTKKKLISSHYTIAQVTRIMGITYNDIRAVIRRCPGTVVTVYGTKMIPQEFIPKLRAARAAIAAEAK